MSLKSLSDLTPEEKLRLASTMVSPGRCGGLDYVDGDPTYRHEKLLASVDSTGEVISVRRRNSAIVSSRDAAHDGYLFLDLDASSNVVGARLVAANEMPLEYWLQHPDRAELPGDILTAFDELLGRR